MGAVNTTSKATNVPVERFGNSVAANIDLADSVPRWAPRVDTHAVVFANYTWVQILSRTGAPPKIATAPHKAGNAYFFIDHLSSVDAPPLPRRSEEGIRRAQFPWLSKLWPVFHLATAPISSPSTLRETLRDKASSTIRRRWLELIKQ